MGTFSTSVAKYVSENIPEKHSMGNIPGKIFLETFNGNELGALLGHWHVSQHLASSSKSKSNLHLLASTVSSKFLDTLAKAEGLTFTETLTGFKHMGNVSDKLLQRGNHRSVKW